jgi:hypothetical protein
MAKHPLGLAIDHFDQARAVDHHQGIRSGLQHLPEPRLAAPQRLVGRRAPGSIANASSVR